MEQRLRGDLPRGRAKVPDPLELVRIEVDMDADHAVVADPPAVAVQVLGDDELVAPASPAQVEGFGLGLFGDQLEHLRARLGVRSAVRGLTSPADAGRGP